MAAVLCAAAFFLSVQPACLTSIKDPSGSLQKKNR
jgi:hypothetical protein